MLKKLLADTLLIKRMFCVIICVFFCLPISYESFAKRFVIGVEAIEYYPLYDFSLAGNSKNSFVKELLSRFFDEKKYEYRFQPLPLKRFNMWYIEENIDFKFPDNTLWRNNETNKLAITYSDDVIRLEAGTYVLLENLCLKRNEVKILGTILGFYPTLWSDLIGTGQVKLFESNSPFSLVKHLLHGNVDALNLDGNVIRYQLKALNKQGRAVLNTELPHVSHAYHLSSIQYPEIIQQFNTFLTKNKVWIKALKDKYDIDEDFTIKL